jgi:MoaA/NifB/PqqE/SkfB family radical SAM enzyme
MPIKNLFREGFNFAPKILGYKFSRAFGLPNMLPVSLTVSVTNKCNSRCRTCFIWKLYQEKPDLKKREFETWEFEKTFESIDTPIFWVTMSGGEPFLRSDLADICSAFNEHCSPKIINIPTNSLLPKVIEGKTKEILERCSGPDLVINLSLDGVGDVHDKIRNVSGNFERFLETYQRLNALKSEFPDLQIGVHSVVSKHSIQGLMDVYEFAEKLGADSYITEVAEQRTELFNIGEDITPSAEVYAAFINKLSERIKKEFENRKKVSKATRAFRLVYYQIAAKELKENKQIIPCYAGLASGQINPYGDVWPCCVLGYNKSIGNLRENDYDFKKIWFSKPAQLVRKYIKSGACSCPLANAHYTNILSNFKQLAKVLGKMIQN